MLKKEIKYEDFNGNVVTEVLYFNLSKSEMMELQAGGLAETLQNMVETKDAHKMVIQLKDLILAAYGVKSDDGKRFIKSDQLREEFAQTAAYDALFMEVTTTDGAAESFMRGILPSDVAGAIPTDKPLMPPPTQGLL